METELLLQYSCKHIRILQRKDIIIIYYYYYYYAPTLFSRLLMLTLIFLVITINLLPLYRLSYFVFCSFNYFCAFLCTRANFVIDLCAVKSARK
jgi:hypothetical protein